MNMVKLHYYYKCKTCMELHNVKEPCPFDKQLTKQASYKQKYNNLDKLVLNSVFIKLNNLLCQYDVCILLEFQRAIQILFNGCRDGLNPKTYIILFTLMRIKNSINERSLNLNILYLNISKQNTKKENSYVKFAEILSAVLSRSTRIKQNVHTVSINVRLSAKRTLE